MLINSRPYQLNTYSTDPQSSSNLIGSVSYRNYLALHDRALTTLNSNTLTKQNSYSGTTSSYNPYENNAYSTIDQDLKTNHTMQSQQPIMTSNYYNTRSKSVSLLSEFFI